MLDQSKQLSRLIESEMIRIGIDRQELSRLSNIPYSTLSPILLGQRDYKVNQVISICNALNIDARKIISPYINISEENQYDQNLEYLISITSTSHMSHITLYSIRDNIYYNQTTKLIFSGGDKVSLFKEKLQTIISMFDGHISPKKIVHSQTAVITSIINSEYRAEVLTLNNSLNKLFYHFETISDAEINQLAYSDGEGIFVTIEDGCAIRYKQRSDEKTVKLQAAGFPLTDIAGNHYLGCLALSHTINVFDSTEEASILSDRILSKYNGQINDLITYAYSSPKDAYIEASSILKELLILKKQSYKIVYNSFKLLKEKIQMIDAKTDHELPIYLIGDCSETYRDMFEKHYRISNTQLTHSEISDKGISILKEKLL